MTWVWDTAGVNRASLRDCERLGLCRQFGTTTIAIRVPD
jgi:hypothetical protein